MSACRRRERGSDGRRVVRVWDGRWVRPTKPKWKCALVAMRTGGNAHWWGNVDMERSLLEAGGGDGCAYFNAQSAKGARAIHKGNERMSLFITRDLIRFAGRDLHAVDRKRPSPRTTLVNTPCRDMNRKTFWSSSAVFKAVGGRRNVACAPIDEWSVLLVSNRACSSSDD